IQGERSLTSQLLEEALDAAFEARLGVAGQHDGERRIHTQAPGTGLDARGHGHEIQSRLLSGSPLRDQERQQNQQEESSQTEVRNEIVGHDSVNSLSLKVRTANQ